MTETIDLRGTRCPLTLLKIKQILVAEQMAEVVTFQFDDAGAARDLPVFLRDRMWWCDISCNSGEFLAVCRKEVKT